MTEPDQALPSSLSEVYLLDVVLAILLAVLVVFFLCGSIRLAHIGGRAAYRVGAFGGQAVYALIDFFSKLYQAALGILIASVILGSLYFYLTTHEQRAHVHATLEKASPATTGLVKQAIQHDAAQQALWHLRNLTSSYFGFQ